MSNSALCDLNSKGDILKLYDRCPSPKCKCRKIIISSHHVNICSRADQKKVD